MTGDTMEFLLLFLFIILKLYCMYYVLNYHWVKDGRFKVMHCLIVFLFMMSMSPIVSLIWAALLYGYIKYKSIEPDTTDKKYIKKQGT